MHFVTASTTLFMHLVLGHPHSPPNTATKLSKSSFVLPWTRNVESCDEVKTVPAADPSMCLLMLFMNSVIASS